MNSLLFWAGLPLYVAAAYLLLNVLYLLAFALAGHLPARPRLASAVSGPPRRMCVLMPAYHADAVIRETAPAALAHAYAGPADVCVVADGLQASTVAALKTDGVNVVEVNFAQSTKGKALLAALTALPADQYDVAVILDVDNVMGADFLTQVNDAFAAGNRVVQGHRTAKNLDSPFAVLDACNEEINNHIFRLGHARLGMSPSLIGSGMAFEYDYLKSLLQDIGDTPGEDKELDFRILRDRVKIAYLPEALVYDEKIGSAAVFGTQRTRWMAAQWEFLLKYSGEGFRQLGRGNWEFFDKIVQTALLPRVLLLGLLTLLVLMSWILPFGPTPGFWAALLLGTGAALLLALPRRLYSRQVALAAAHLPVALGAMALALLQLKKAKTSFLPTPHAATASRPT
ncbi:glycosyltransferase [Hymenobacter artigasi]|uniref:Cellulose synthase/poly-beta-1,6-N-acetylglucosamine synthase-like glycosyltransferase n=1 Tax=Hymenobacter artigasi TaxID=2719616 RepID=A0ABX1HGP3_9BACT|nr:glycosyltransferase family 2 protein [Hymenobacter artigasi]NKI89367.1 cellulose synthase/poly-beta-1,6-N-acetylglucosamine synthase-like glycosyltransferase [Hymenobacter artigasi]